MIANLGGFDEITPIGAKYDQTMLDLSGWSASELDAAGWQFVDDSSVNISEFLSITTVSNGNFQVQFFATTGENYRVAMKDDLTSSNDWQTVTNIISLPKSPIKMTAPMTNDAGFYRLIWEP